MYQSRDKKKIVLPENNLNGTMPNTSLGKLTKNYKGCIYMIIF